jgi:BlaI family penicillinase repressor
MNKDYRIPPSELAVMKVIWNKQQCTAAQIVEEISKSSSWHFRTIKALLRNLVNKQLVGYHVDDKDSRIYHYYPLIQEEDYLKQERQQFLDLYYEGDVSTMLVGFLQDKGISSNEVKRLTDLLKLTENSSEE